VKVSHKEAGPDANETAYLNGYRILDFTQYLAGPTTTRFLAEMGAEVIKIELAPVGDYGRFIPYVHDGRSAFYVQQNRGKKSLCSPALIVVHRIDLALRTIPEDVLSQPLPVKFGYKQ
jgi:hypothetical protein